MKDQLNNYFQRYITLTEEEFLDIWSYFDSKIYQPKAFILSKGQVCRYKYFIIEGLVRAYYIDNEEKEKITQFALENWWFTQMESFIKGTPSNLWYQAIEKTTVLRIHKDQLDKLYKQHPKLERFFRIINENMLIAIQRRSDFFMQMSSKERYYHFVERLPHFAQRVPQYMIASYLDISPEHLSTIRKPS